MLDKSDQISRANVNVIPNVLNTSSQIWAIEEVFRGNLPLVSSNRRVVSTFPPTLHRGYSTEKLRRSYDLIR